MEASRLGAATFATPSWRRRIRLPLSEWRAPGQFAINGVALDPLDRTIANGCALAARHAEITIAAFERSLSR